MKKLLSIVLAVIMIATTIPFAFAADDGMLLYVDITNALGTDKSAEGVWLYAFSRENDSIVNSEEMTHVSENIYSYEIPSNTYIAAVGVPFTDGTRVEWNFVIDWTGNNLYIPTGDGVGTWEIYSDCSHESYTDGKCDACGAECRHKNITDGICDDCGAEGRFITITMTDSYGDGWNGNAIVIEKLIDGTYTEVSTATIENGNNGTFTAILPEDGVYALRWVRGEYPAECSFTVTVNGESVFETMNGDELVDGQVVYTNCEHDWSNKDGICDICGAECQHENITDTICDDCGVAGLHVYDNGFCSDCGAYEPATDYNADGVYEIYNGGQLFWFAQQVNEEGNKEIKGTLRANIDLENRPWTPIGAMGEENSFRG
ncbi:MAG: hypothetical protein IJM97_04545, partial [Clostridia bacterium]|nr:hypothetical protein [Clostridia bacterium]